MHHSAPCLGVVDCWRSGQRFVLEEMVVYNSAAVFDDPVGISRLKETTVIYELFSFYPCIFFSDGAVIAFRVYHVKRRLLQSSIIECLATCLGKFLC